MLKTRVITPIDQPLQSGTVTLSVITYEYLGCRLSAVITFAL